MDSLKCLASIGTDIKAYYIPLQYMGMSLVVEGMSPWGECEDHITVVHSCNY